MWEVGGLRSGLVVVSRVWSFLWRQTGCSSSCQGVLRDFRCLGAVSAGSWWRGRERMGWDAQCQEGLRDWWNKAGGTAAAIPFQRKPEIAGSWEIYRAAAESWAEKHLGAPVLKVLPSVLVLKVFRSHHRARNPKCLVYSSQHSPTPQSESLGRDI